MISNKSLRLRVGSALMAAAIAVPAIAGHLTERERRFQEGEVAAGRSVTDDLMARKRALDDAYNAADSMNRVLRGTACRATRLGCAAYDGGSAIGRTIERAYSRR